MATVKDAAHYHNQHLDKFKGASNGSRNNTLNEQAVQSFGYALGNGNLTISKVEQDYTDAAKALQMEDNGVKATLRSALDGAIPRDLSAKDNNTHNGNSVTLKTNLTLAPIYTALEDYAVAHGVPVKAFEDAKWAEGTHNKRPCLKVPCEDGVTRVRFLDGNSPKWMPIKTSDTKITPCWYGFNGAIAKAKLSKDKTIVLCNGQPSVVAAQHYGIPALAQTDGEGKLIEGPLMRRLESAIKAHGLKIVLAYDGDDTGRACTDNIKKQLQKNGITPRIVYFGGDDGYDLADYCKQHKSGIMDKLIRLSRYGQTKLNPVVSRNELVNQAYNTLAPNQGIVSAGEMLVTPFKSFHRLGGFAFILHPGRITMILAPSGGGKTSFMETWGDFWNKKGFDTLWFSPEWSPLSMQYRAIQRYSGVSTDAVASHKLYEAEAERGIAEGQRQGEEIKPGSKPYEDYNDANDDIGKWPGLMHAFQGQKVTGDILEDMSKTIWLARRNERRVGCAFFDYVQILRTDQEAKDYSSYEMICSEVSQWSKDMDIHAIIGSQPTKSVGENSIKTGALLSEYDAMWMRPDVAQLIITLNIKHNKVADDLLKTDYATANICKNNEGQTGLIKLRTNFQRLSWIPETRFNA